MEDDDTKFLLTRAVVWLMHEKGIISLTVNRDHFTTTISPHTAVRIFSDGTDLHLQLVHCDDTADGVAPLRYPQ